MLDPKLRSHLYCIGSLSLTSSLSPAECPVFSLPVMSELVPSAGLKRAAMILEMYSLFFHALNS